MIQEAKVLFFMNKNEKMHEWIDRFNDNELNGEELKKFLELLKNDPALRAELRLDKELNELLQDEGLLSLRKKIIEVRTKREDGGIGKKIFLLAASILVILVLSVILYLVVGLKTRNNKILQTNNSPANGLPVNKNSSPELNNRKNNPGKQQFMNDTLSMNRPGISNKQSQPLIAANYKPFPPFESLIGTHIRSEYFKLIEPFPNSHFKTKSLILFSWETDIFHPLTVEIMDNKGQLIFDSHPVHDKSLKVPSGTLKNGLFYFKILKEDEIVFFGKFTIEIM